MARYTHGLVGADFYSLSACMFAPGDVCKQVIQVPATSVWSVAVETNGDIVAGSR